MNDSKHRLIKWSYTTHLLPHLPQTLGELSGKLVSDESGSPNPNDVVVAEVVELGRHKRISLTDASRAKLFVGDLVGIAYGYRYATRQYEGAVPASFDPCHLLSAGGVCGAVVGMAEEMEPPTLLRPLGFVTDDAGQRVNLKQHALRPVQIGMAGSATIMVVGSSMDSGKTRAAYSIIHGLYRAGLRVCAAKITGTAAPKDLQLMKAAGAERLLDFTDVGHTSTARCSRDELWNLVATIKSQLSQSRPDAIVFEIADGISQRETEILLGLNRVNQYVDATVYACSDALGVQAGVNMLSEYDANVVAVSGWVGCSPLSIREAQEQTDLPVLRTEELQDPSVTRSLFSDILERQQRHEMIA